EAGGDAHAGAGEGSCRLDARPARREALAWRRRAHQSAARARATRRETAPSGHGSRQRGGSSAALSVRPEVNKTDGRQAPKRNLVLRLDARRLALALGRDLAHARGHGARVGIEGSLLARVELEGQLSSLG